MDGVGLSVLTNTAVEMCGLGARCLGGHTDSDHESVVSDYSEMADPVKEHLANIHILQEAELRFGSVLGLPAQQPYAIRPWLAVQRRPDEDETEFLQRQKKVNFLSLAQEFAAVKRTHPDALPFNLHRHKNVADSKEEGNEESDDVSLAQELAVVSCVDEANDEVGQIGTSCLEQEHNDGTTDGKHIDESSNAVTNSCSKPVVICVGKEDCNSEFGAVASSVPDVVQGLHDCSTSKQPDMNRVDVNLVDNCHLSDVLTGDDAVKYSDELANTVTSRSNNVDLMRQQQQRENIRLKLVLSDEDISVFGTDSRMLQSDMTSSPSSSASLRMCFMNEAAFDDDDDDDDDDMDCYHEETASGPLGSPDLIAGMRRPALQEYVSCKDGHDRNTSILSAAQLSTKLHRKEMGQDTRSDLLETSAMEWKLDRFHRLSLQRLNIAQLQVVINDQLSRIEALNNELLEFLVERDDLHRTQDSLLVDVEDLSRFLTKVTNAEASPAQLETLQH